MFETDPSEPEWTGLAAWTAGGTDGIRYMTHFEAAGFCEAEAGRLAVKHCELDADGRIAYVKELAELLKK